MRGKRSLVARYLQLKSGHAIVGTYLQRIKAEESAQCQWCSERKQSPQHLIFTCRRWRKPRKPLIRALRKMLGRDPQEGDLKTVFLDTLTLECLQFLKDTQIGLRGGNRAEENQADMWDIQLLDPGEGLT